MLFRSNVKAGRLHFTTDKAEAYRRAEVIFICVGTPSDDKGHSIANRVQPLKRPRSSMSPTLVFDADSGELLMSAGSPGGALIIHYTAKTLYAVLNWGLHPQQAVALPNFSSTNGPTLLEAGRFNAATQQALKNVLRGCDSWLL